MDVVMGRRSAEARHDFRRFRLPWDRSVRSVRVSPNDVVQPTDEEHPWYGRAASTARRTNSLAIDEGSGSARKERA